MTTWNKAHTLKANVEWVDTDGCTNDPSDCNLFLNSVTKGVTASVKAAVLLQAEGKFKGGDYIGTLKNGGAAFIQDHGTAGKANSAATVAGDRDAHQGHRERLHQDPRGRQIVHT